MATFDQFLDSLDTDENRKGKQFEVFVKIFLKKHPYWSTKVDQIWLWDEWPGRWGRDKGIDLVFKDKSGETWAVQAKCKSQDYYITKSDVDKFLAESNREQIDKRLFITTTDRIGGNAIDTINNQHTKAVTLFRYANFEEADVDYPVHFSKLSKTKRKKIPTPKTHQRRAVNEVEKRFKNNDRGQLIMACGTGKTYTTLWIKERIKSKSTLVLVPSLSLLSQTLKEWTFASKESFDALCVCSDATVAKNLSYDSIEQSVNDLPFTVTSNVKEEALEEIKKFLKGRGSKVIFSTYQSSPLIAESQSEIKNTMFDLMIVDEAHKCTGDAGSLFTTCLDESKIKSKRRLFSTATPKIFEPNLKKRADERGVKITSMDDEKIFGRVFFSLSFGEAIKDEILSDYRVVIVGVDKPMIAEWIEKRELVKTPFTEKTNAESLAAKIGLIKTIKDYDLKRIITFHSRVKRAKDFALETVDTIKIVPEKHRPEGEILMDFVHGSMTTDKRNKKLKQLKDLTNVDRLLLSNARCLGEGVDVPKLDGVGFIDPKGSKIDIIQAVGRAIRRKGDTLGTIFLPVFIEEGDEVEQSIQSSNFKPVWDVLNALKAHDDDLSKELDQLRINIGKNYGSKQNNVFTKVYFDLPRTVDESFSESLKTILVEKTTESWNFWYGLLEDYVDSVGDALVPRPYVVDGKYKLGGWVSNQRTIKNKLTSEKIKKLESFEGWTWDAKNYKWERNFKELLKYIDQYGTSLVRVNYITETKIKLGTWVSNLRINKQWLSNHQIKRLENLIDWTWDFFESKWLLGKSNLIEYFKEHGDTLLRADHVCPNGYKLGNWVGVVRNSYKKGKLSKDKIKFLESFESWAWNKKEYLWNIGFNYLLNYIKEYGNSKVPDNFRNNENYHLGQWVKSQRMFKVRMLPERIIMFENLIGWSWDVREDEWNQNFEDLKNYYAKYNTQIISRDYKTSYKRLLSLWVSRQKAIRKNLSKEKTKRLESLDFWVWDKKENQWNIGFEQLKEYTKKHGDSIVSKSHFCEDGYNLGGWVATQRQRKDKLDQEKIHKLENLDGWVWSVNDESFEKGYRYLIEFQKKFGNCLVQQNLICDDGFNLGTWVSSIRAKKKIIPDKNKIRLENLDGWAWNFKIHTWEIAIESLKIFINENGHSSVKSDYKDKNGFKLGYFVRNIRSRKNKLNKEKIDELNEIGFGWEKKFEQSWTSYIDEYKKYISKYKSKHVQSKFITDSGKNLGLWVANTRTRKKQLSNYQIKQLNELGFIWDTRKYFFEINLSRLKEYIKENGNAKVPATYKSQDGYNFGTWISNIRRGKRKISIKEKKALSELGFCWEI